MRHLVGQALWRSLVLADFSSESPGSGAAGNPTSSGGSTPGPRRELGPIGVAARLVLGSSLFGSVVYGQLATHDVRPATWALGLVGFPALVLAWHAWRIRRHPARFSDDSPLSFVLGILLFVALYFTWWYAPALSVTSDAALIFFGGAMLLTALRGDAGCEILTPSNWLLRRHDQIACALFAPIDALERRWVRP
jgi:hypothetical protein